MTRKRRSSKEIRDLICQEIVAGTWAADEQMPTRDMLVRRFGGSKGTIQEALRQLTEEGFIQSRGRGGTFVSAWAPHRTCFGLVFNDRPRGEKWTHFFQTIREEAERTEEVAFKCYFDAQPQPGNRALTRLLEDIQSHRLAGFFLCAASLHLQRFHDDLLQVPAVGFGDDEENPFPLLDIDMDRILERSLERVRESGRRRVAFLSYPHDGGDRWGDTIRRLVGKHGLNTHPWWNVEAHPAQSHNVVAITQLLLQGEADRRPEALVITDDNLVPAATQAVISLGFSSDDLLVVAHANFPQPTQSVHPALRIGVDCGELLRKGIELLRDQRAGQTVPTVTPLQIRFSEELQQHVTA